MTKTYTDVDMVVELLQEKENDLELAARIGQSLLEENQQQRSINEALEDQINSLLEQVMHEGQIDNKEESTQHWRTKSCLLEQTLHEGQINSR